MNPGECNHVIRRKVISFLEAPFDTGEKSDLHYNAKERRKREQGGQLRKQEQPCDAEYDEEQGASSGYHPNHGFLQVFNISAEDVFIEPHRRVRKRAKKSMCK